MFRIGPLSIQFVNILPFKHFSIFLPQQVSSSYLLLAFLPLRHPFPCTFPFILLSQILQQSKFNVNSVFVDLIIQINMSSKAKEARLTLQNLQEELRKWKQPYLLEADRTSDQFQKKVEEYRKNLIENDQHIQTNQSQKTEQKRDTREKSQKMIKNGQGVIALEKRVKSREKQKEKGKTLATEPKFQEWKHLSQYGFSNYEQLARNYDEVFQKKQKVNKMHSHTDKLQDFRADERQMVLEIYEQLKNPKDMTVLFEDLQQFFQTYELFYYFYNIHPYRLMNLLRQSARRYENKLTKQQFFDFFLVDRPTVLQFRSATQKNLCSRCILSEQNWRKLKNIFDTLDTFGNEKIYIKTLFQRLRNSSSHLSLLSSSAIEYPEIQRVYSLEKVLFELENKKQFPDKLDWQTIEQQIHNFSHIEEPTLDQIYASKLEMAKITKDSNCFMLEPKVIEIIKQIFNRCPKYCNSFVKTSFFSFQLLEAGILRPYFECSTRLENSSKNTFLSLDQVIRKLGKQAPCYIDMDQMLQLISVKGPQNSKWMIHLYDQIENQSSEEQQSLQRRSQRKLKKMRSLEELKKTVNKKLKKKPIYQVTQVKQFNLHSRQQPTIRELKVKQMIKQKQLKEDLELGKKFKANPIPVTLNPQKYQKYAKGLQKKKQSILNRLGIKREKDQIIIDYLKSNTKLFEAKKGKPHCEQPLQNYFFEAKPLPLHISQQLLPKIQAEKEQRRKLLQSETKKKYYEVYWKNLKNTSFFQKDQSLLQKINMIQDKKKFQKLKAKQVPNFKQLHLRFQEELQSRRLKGKVTEIQQFKLSSPHRSKFLSTPPSEQFQFRSKTPPIKNKEVIIKTTKKYEDMVAHHKAKAAQRQLGELEKEKEQQERIMKQRNFAKFMRKYLVNCTNNLDNLRQKSEDKKNKIREEARRLEKETGENLAHIYARVLQKPFLFQSVEKTTKQFSKQQPKKIRHYQKVQQNEHPYKDGLFEKEGEEFHPIQSENLNQSF